MQVVDEADVKQLTSGWWLVFLVGLLSLAAGVILIFKPGDSLATLAVIAGIFLLLDGILELIGSFMRRTANRGLVALIGVITAIVGVLLIRHPVGGVTAIALLSDLQSKMFDAAVNERVVRGPDETRDGLPILGTENGIFQLRLPPTQYQSTMLFAAPINHISSVPEFRDTAAIPLVGEAGVPVS